MFGLRVLLDKIVGWKHHCRPIPTGKRVRATFGKDNLPAGTSASWSQGEIAHCACGKRWLMHDPVFKFPSRMTELIGIV